MCVSDRPCDRAVGGGSAGAGGGQVHGPGGGWLQSGSPLGRPGGRLGREVSGSRVDGSCQVETLESVSLRGPARLDERQRAPPLWSQAGATVRGRMLQVDISHPHRNGQHLDSHDRILRLPRRHHCILYQTLL